MFGIFYVENCPLDAKRMEEIQSNGSAIEESKKHQVNDRTNKKIMVILLKTFFVETDGLSI